MALAASLSLVQLCESRPNSLITAAMSFHCLTSFAIFVFSPAIFMDIRYEYCLHANMSWVSISMYQVSVDVAYKVCIYIYVYISYMYMYGLVSCALEDVTVMLLCGSLSCNSCCSVATSSGLPFSSCLGKQTTQTSQ